MNKRRGASYARGRGVALNPWIRTCSLWRIWTHLGWQDLRGRYARTLMGPLWTAVSVVTTMLIMSGVYATLFAQPIGDYVMYVFPAFATWYFISTLLVEGPGQFTSSKGLLLNSTFPIEVITMRVVWRNFVTTLMIFPIVFAAGVAVEPGRSVLLLQALGGLALCFMAGIPVCYFLGLLGVRFADLSILMGPASLLLLLVTPIFWPVSAAAGRTWLYEWNPIYWFIETVRAGFEGELVPASVWLGCVAFTCLLTALALLMAPRQYSTVKVSV